MQPGPRPALTAVAVSQDTVGSYSLEFLKQLARRKMPIGAPATKASTLSCNMAMHQLLLHGMPL